MEKSNISPLRALLNQALRFIGLSGIGWLLDFGVYTLLSFVSENLAVNNMLSSLVGASFVFVFSTRFVFRDSHNIPLVFKYAIYVLYQLVLIYLISHLLAWVNSVILALFTMKLIHALSAVLSKMIVTPITMAVNFFAMKFVIEKL